MEYLITDLKTMQAIYNLQDSDSQVHKDTQRRLNNTHLDQMAVMEARAGSLGTNEIKKLMETCSKERKALVDIVYHNTDGHSFKTLKEQIDRTSQLL
ncbi:MULTISPECIES: hypothetical protein [Xenorhabdus]|uniref:Uncharacterized protein n=1 Tax=Xenorhabdus ehlersii TaxID=290111 RepID=A0A2D0IL12_9GAMM|nr:MULTISPECIES: hypothetical protein [Xenorhabdus]MBC8948419.1 hypothetical protein [Xenorhabdus sp. TS4]PHM22472.1 hypothetical protein Xehl_03620 [Xenorhabdus ehlersii]RKE88694.1 hypothetical protein BDE27_3345 [Xenorhabdus ehlersii]